METLTENGKQTVSKIKTIEIINFKAIDALGIDFKGCTAIVVGANNSGKTSFLRGIPDRIRGQHPDVVVKKGSTKGSGTLTLTTGEKFEWEFDTDGKDKLSFYTKEGYKTKVTQEIAKRFFPPVFDIDKFLNSPPKEQSKQLQKIIGIDFTDIDSRYKIAYDDRTEKNRDAEKFHVKLSEMLVCDKVDPVDLTELQKQKEEIRTRLNKLYTDNVAANKKLSDDFDIVKAEKRKEVRDLNKIESDKQDAIDNANSIKEELVKFLFENSIEKMVDISKLELFISHLVKPGTILDEEIEIGKLDIPKYIDPVKPDDKELVEIDAKILTASDTNTKAKAYTDYIEYKAQVETAKQLALDADILVKGIEQERYDLIQTAKLPEGISITPDGITVDGFPLDKNQISTSKLYCTALRFASLNLGEVKSLHFDASPLDKNTLKEIQDWSEENNLQLLIERPDYEGGEIKYELLEN